MPVTLQIGDIAPRAWKQDTVTTASDLFSGTSRKEFNRSKRIIQSSLLNQYLASNVVSPSKNGLVYTLHHAWSGHHHLTLRPEDIWFAILSQLSFYVNAHGEELRAFFVAHEGQEELETIDYGTIDTVDFGPIAEKMTHLIQKNVLDPELREWIMPAFSTTTKSDRVVASILMMGSLQTYFSYKMTLCCGIPSVTLLGDKRDWETLVKKLERIPQLGAEPAQFSELLRPVLERFVRSFDTPKDSDIITFWNRVAHQSGGSGPRYLSGWVTAFCFWDEDGKSLHGEPEKPVTQRSSARGNAGYELDGVCFHRVKTDDIPSGFASVPVKVNDHGKLYYTKMLAGSVGMQASSSGQMLDESSGHEGFFSFKKMEQGKTAKRDLQAPNSNEAARAPGLDTLQPVTGWWMYEVEGEEDVRERQHSLNKLKKEIQSMGSFGDYPYGSEKYERYVSFWSEVSRLEQF